MTEESPYESLKLIPPVAAASSVQSRQEARVQAGQGVLNTHVDEWLTICPVLLDCTYRLNVRACRRERVIYPGLEAP